MQKVVKVALQLSLHPSRTVRRPIRIVGLGGICERLFSFPFQSLLLSDVLLFADNSLKEDDW